MRRVAIVSVGAVASVGLAALAVFTFGAALPHAIFLGGLGFTAMIKALEYSDDKSEKKLQQLRLEKTNLIRKRNAVTVGVSDGCTKFTILLDQQARMKEPSPQENKHKRHCSLTIFPQSPTEEGGSNSR